MEEAINRVDENGNKFGLWKHRSRDYTTAEGHYINGLKEGLWTEYYANSNVAFRGNYKKGKPHGAWESFYENGNIYGRGSIKDTRLVDYWKWYRENEPEHLLDEIIYIN